MILRSLIAGFFTLGFGGGGGGISGSLYSPTGLGSADTAWQSMLSQEMNNISAPMAYAGSQLPGLYQQLIGNIGNAAPGIEGMASGQAAPYLANMAGQADQFHNIMSGAGMTDYGMQTGLQNAGNAVWQTAQDPQQQLYNRTAQQVQDQSRASSSARGLGTSPYAAGLENQAMGNFNIDWQNQQLKRQMEGLAGMTSADKAAGTEGAAGSQQLTGSQAMSALAPQLLMQSAQLPYETTLGLLNAGLSNASNFMGAEMQTQMNPLAGMMSQIIPYMNYGAGAQANAFNAGQANLGNLVGLGGMLTNDFGMGPGAGMGALGSLFGGGGGADAAAAGAAGLGTAAAAGGADAAAGAGAADAAATAAMAWVVCTELHRQGRMSSRLYYTAAPAFLKYPERGKRGYYVWAVPSTRHLREHPNSAYSKLLERVFNARATYIVNRKRGRPTTVSGAIVTHGLYALCWLLSWFVPERLARWHGLYQGGAHAHRPE